jgi:hypothetical protein
MQTKLALKQFEELKDKVDALLEVWDQTKKARPSTEDFDRRRSSLNDLRVLREQQKGQTHVAKEATPERIHYDFRGLKDLGPGVHMVVVHEMVGSTVIIEPAIKTIDSEDTLVTVEESSRPLRRICDPMSLEQWQAMSEYFEHRKPKEVEGVVDD